MKILSLINLINLSNNLLLIIKSFIPKTIILFLTKENYLKYQKVIKKIIINIKKSYMRFLLRNDFDFIFLFRIKEYGNNWCKNSKTKYKNMFFKNKLLLYKYYTIDNNSEKCKTIISNYINENMDLKQHKNININNNNNNNTWIV